MQSDSCVPLCCESWRCFFGPLVFSLLLVTGCGRPVAVAEFSSESGQGARESVAQQQERGGELAREDAGPFETRVPELILESGRDSLPEGVIPEESSSRKQLPIRGITLSAPRGGSIYGTSGIEATMAELLKLGSNWISYHPYAWIGNDGSLRFDESVSQSQILHPIQQGKKLKMGVLLKPHIGYWGSKFSWRGEIGFGQNEAEWKRFFDDYTRWIVTLAKMAEAAGAEMIAIGTEYKLTEQRKEWFAVIAAVRKVYKGKLTYAANWDSFDKVPFWGKLDYIGIQAYFPLSDVIPPKEKDIAEGWKRVLLNLKAYAEKVGKPMIFTEIGYNRSAWAAQKPWDHKQGGPMAEETKLLCMKVTLEQLKTPRFLKGVFLWKWFPDGRIASRDFLLQYPAMKELLRMAWVEP